MKENKSGVILSGIHRLLEQRLVRVPPNGKKWVRKVSEDSGWSVTVKGKGPEV